MRVRKRGQEIQNAEIEREDVYASESCIIRNTKITVNNLNKETLI